MCSSCGGTWRVTYPDGRTADFATPAKARLEASKVTGATWAKAPK